MAFRRLRDAVERPDHPVIAHYRETWTYDDFFDEERLDVGLKAYYGLCSFLDFQVGRVLGALDESGFADDTLVLYTSDHGESLGNRGLSRRYPSDCASVENISGNSVGEITAASEARFQ